MNTAKWDAIAESFERGEFVPANGWEAWRDQALREAATIRDAIPGHVLDLIEIGCGVGRLTPHLSLLFPRVIATDTSAVCRRVTLDRCREYGVENVDVYEAYFPVPGARSTAAVVWGNLYDSDWTEDVARAHTRALMDEYPIVLFQQPPPITLRAGESIVTRDQLDFDGEHYVSTPDWLRFEQ